MDHRERHKKLHEALDELAACYMLSTGKRVSNTTLLELLEWSHKATLDADACASGPKGTGDCAVCGRPMTDPHPCPGPKGTGDGT